MSPFDAAWRLLKNYKSQDFIFNPDYGAGGYYNPNTKEHFVNLAQLGALDEQGAIERITRTGTHEAIHAAQDSELQHLRGEDGRGHFSAHEVGAHSAQDPYEMQDWRNWQMSRHNAMNPYNFETNDSGEVGRKATNPNTVTDVTPMEKVYLSYEDDDEFEDGAFVDHDFALMSNKELNQWASALRAAELKDEPDFKTSDEMKNDPYYKFLLGRGDNPTIRDKIQDELDRRVRQVDVDGGYHQRKFKPDFQDKLASEPMDLAWRLLKEDSLDPEERTPIKDEMLNDKFPSAGPYWTLNDRQKRIADAIMDLPDEAGGAAYLSSEGWDGYDFDHLFAEGHETVTDQEYDRLEATLRYFKDYIKDHMAHPDTDKSPEFLDGDNSDHPEHPWSMARNMAYGETEPYDGFSEKFQDLSKSEKHPGNQTRSVHQAAPELKPKRKYFPTTLVHEDATEGIQRRVNPFKEEEGTFEGLPFKDDFKRSEPMDLAWRLLKSKYVGGPEQTILPSGDKPFNPKSRSLFQRKRPSRRERTTPARVHMNISTEGARNFHLLDHEGNRLSTIEDSTGYDTIGRYDTKGQHSIKDFHGFTPSEQRRKGYYRDLMESVLRHGFALNSDDRNESSNPFHERFLQTLPYDVKAIVDSPEGDLNELDTIRYEGLPPAFSRTKDLDYGDLAVETRSKFPITYDTPYQYYQSKLNRGIDPMQDILNPTDNGPKRYRQSRLAGLGGPSSWDGGESNIRTKEGIVIPHRDNVFNTPFDQTRISYDSSRPSAQTMMGFGIDPMTRMRQQVGVVDSGAPRPGSSGLDEKQLRRAQLDDKLMSGRNLTTEELDEYGG